MKPKKTSNPSIKKDIDESKLSWHVTSHINKAVAKATALLKGVCVEEKDFKRLHKETITDSNVALFDIKCRNIEADSSIDADTITCEELRVKSIESGAFVRGGMAITRLVSFSVNAIELFAHKLGARKISAQLGRVSYIKSKAVVADAMRVGPTKLTKLGVDTPVLISAITEADKLRFGEAKGADIFCTTIDTGEIAATEITGQRAEIVTVKASKVESASAIIGNVRGKYIVSGHVRSDSIASDSITGATIDEIKLKASNTELALLRAKSDIKELEKEIAALEKDAALSKQVAASNFVKKSQLKESIATSSVSTENLIAKCATIALTQYESLRAFERARLPMNSVALVDGKVVVMGDSGKAISQKGSDNITAIVGSELATGHFIKTPFSGLMTTSVTIKDRRDRYSIVKDFMIECLDEGIKVTVPNASSSYHIIITGV